MPNKHGSSANYRYGFNGKENDDELKGEGNSYDFGARMLDPRVGRWWGKDPDKRGWINPYSSFSNNPIRYIDPDGRWQTDGHYWTILLLAEILGIPNAEEIARYAEYPDTDIMGYNAKERYTWIDGSEQSHTHSLTNGWHTDERGNTLEMLLDTDIINVKEFGRLLHRLGDTYAHSRLDNPERMYGVGNSNDGGWTAEHFVGAGSEPDMIYNRTGENGGYVNYTKDVLYALSDKNLSNVSYMEAFDRAMPIINELMSYAKENKVSLVGIINYQVAKIQGKKEFFVYNVESVLPTDYSMYVQNTRNYLNSIGVKFKEEKKFEIGTYYCEKCNKEVEYNAKELGTEFKIED